MRWARLGLVMVVPLLAACPEETPKEEDKLIEYLDVVGTCVEDHVGTCVEDPVGTCVEDPVRPLPQHTSEYRGIIAHWLYVTENEHRRYGFVSKAFNIDDSVKKIKDPHKYRPPSTVLFRDVTAEQLAANTLTLKGLSDRYEATCTLKVERRLNCWPVSKKEVEENRRLGQDIPAHWCDPDTIDPREKKE